MITLILLFVLILSIYIYLVLGLARVEKQWRSLTRNSRAPGQNMEADPSPFLSHLPSFQFPFPSLSFIFPHFHPLPFPLLYSPFSLCLRVHYTTRTLPSLKSKTLQIQLGGLGDHCELHQWGLGHSPSINRIWCILGLKYNISWVATILIIFMIIN